MQLPGHRVVSAFRNMAPWKFQMLSPRWLCGETLRLCNVRGRSGAIWGRYSLQSASNGRVAMMVLYQRELQSLQQQQQQQQRQEEHYLSQQEVQQMAVHPPVFLNPTTVCLDRPRQEPQGCQVVKGQRIPAILGTRLPGGAFLTTSRTRRSEYNYIVSWAQDKTMHCSPQQQQQPVLFPVAPRTPTICIAFESSQSKLRATSARSVPVLCAGIASCSSHPEKMGMAIPLVINGHPRRALSTKPSGGQNLSAQERVEDGRQKIFWTPEVVPRLYTRFRGSDPISQLIAKIWDKERQSRARYLAKVAFRDLLAQDVFIEYHVTIVGSSASGFGFNNSDVDICLQFRNNFLPISYNEKKVLEMLKQRLLGQRGVRQVVLVPAIVPLISFHYKQDRDSPVMRVDLNLGNEVGIVNTQLLFAYSRMDSRVAPLVLAMKRWASNMMINSAQEGTLSSYSLTLMVLYFLQREGVIPILHHDVPEFSSGRGFEKDQPFLLPAWSSHNKLCVGALFRQVLEFYSEFDFPNWCISVREGKVIPLKEAVAQDPDTLHTTFRGTTQSSRNWWKFISIQEPFNYTNTARSVFQQRSLDEVVAAFRRSREIIGRTGGPKILLQ